MLDESRQIFRRKTGEQSILERLDR